MSSKYFGSGGKCPGCLRQDLEDIGVNISFVLPLVVKIYNFHPKISNFHPTSNIKSISIKLWKMYIFYAKIYFWSLITTSTAKNLKWFLYLDPTTLEKNGYFAQQMAFLTNSDASLTERLKFPRSWKKIVKLSKRKHLSLNNM